MPRIADELVKHYLDGRLLGFELGFAMGIRALRPDLIGSKTADELRDRVVEAFKKGLDLPESERVRLLDEAVTL